MCEMPEEGGADGKDFFISRTGADRAWAAWIGYVLEEGATRSTSRTGTSVRGRASSGTCRRGRRSAGERWRCCPLTTSTAPSAPWSGRRRSRGIPRERIVSWSPCGCGSATRGPPTSGPCPSTSRSATSSARPTASTGLGDIARERSDHAGRGPPTSGPWPSTSGFRSRTPSAGHTGIWHASRTRRPIGGGTSGRRGGLVEHRARGLGRRPRCRVPGRLLRARAPR